MPFLCELDFNHVFLYLKGLLSCFPNNCQAIALKYCDKDDIRNQEHPLRLARSVFSLKRAKQSQLSSQRK
jgi:hypothetical protein